MSIYVSTVVEDEFVTCQLCNQTFKTDEIEVGEDWHFAWDGYVDVDCCNNCQIKKLSD